MREFFSHEVQSFPPALCEFGNIRLPNSKLDLSKCLKPNSRDDNPNMPRQFDSKILDGSIVVQSPDCWGFDIWRLDSEGVYSTYPAAASNV